MIATTRRYRAFTLVEIMTVVLIIGVLLGIAVPGYTRSRDVARKNSCIRNLRLIDTAKEHWAGEYKMANGAEMSWNDVVGTNRYIKFQPECPSGGTYAVNPIGSNPTCTIAGHALQSGG